jgi:hypothetical protein
MCGIEMKIKIDKFFVKKNQHIRQKQIQIFHPHVKTLTVLK